MMSCRRACCACRLHRHAQHALRQQISATEYNSIPLGRPNRPRRECDLSGRAPIPSGVSDDDRRRNLDAPRPGTGGARPRLRGAEPAGRGGGGARRRGRRRGLAPTPRRSPRRGPRPGRRRRGRPRRRAVRHPGAVLPPRQDAALHRRRTAGGDRTRLRRHARSVSPGGRQGGRAAARGRRPGRVRPVRGGGAPARTPPT